MISKSFRFMQGMPRSLSNNIPLETTSKYGKGSTIIVDEDASSIPRQNMSEDDSKTN